MDSCVKKAKLQKNDISQILLVGGSTRMPCVISAIKEVMGKEPTKGVNVDEAVASGAALYAGTIADKSDLNEAQKDAMSKIDLVTIMQIIDYIKIWQRGFFFFFLLGRCKAKREKERRENTKNRGEAEVAAGCRGHQRGSDSHAPT